MDMPMRLLTPECALVDPFRQLLILAIADGVFANVKRWADLSKLNASPNGRRVVRNPGFDDVLIFRHADGDAFCTGDLDSLLPNVGLAAGFVFPLTGYQTRRGISNVLHERVSDTNLRHLLGHDSTSWYKNG